MATTPDLIPVTTRIEPELREQLTAKRKAALRSEAMEIKMAIRAWVAEDRPAEPQGVETT
jgi:hypothetical protein